MKGPSFGLHPEAALDIELIWEYVARDSPIAAGTLRREIFATIKSIVTFPRQGHRRPDLTARPLRFVVLREYLIAYAPDEKPLWVIAVIHGRRSPRVIAAILRGREDPPTALI